ncbi:Imm26 family immunity protein [Bacillus sp. BP-3]|uniref:Imm26 family immunity protein n=1 Tax=Bacillus sp. BP-3 TaxID=3022773 RepID=UPI00232F6EAA|nr:Imm26 family immunity protein [Bacillus sp. BP-3]MDC2867245.1 Imm26 family immunity protein [Bacillus sp. BP-3]
MSQSVLFNELDHTLQIGKINISVPDYSSNQYVIFEDLAEFFCLETNYDAMIFIRNRVKEAGIKGKVGFDSESDYVEIYSANGKIVLQIAVLLNELMEENFVLENQKEYEQFIASWKRPRKQKWRVGDIFSISLPNKTYFFGQIVELMEGISPICVIFDLNCKHVPSKEEIKKSEVITALMFNGMEFDNYTFKVLFNMDIMGEVEENTRRDPVRNVTWHVSSLIEFCIDYKSSNRSSTIEDIVYNRNFVRKI